MDINPMYAAILGSFLRWGLAFVAGYFVSKGIWTDVEAVTYVTAIVTGLVAIGWSLYQKYGQRLKLTTALATPRAISEKEVDQMVKAGQAPPVTLSKESVPYLKSNSSTADRNYPPAS